LTHPASLATLPLIEKWISFASVSCDSNLPIIEWTQDWLEVLGIECSRTCDDSGQKDNLWATPTWCRSTADLGSPT
jgi:acetylornithine deacetylase